MIGDETGGERVCFEESGRGNLYICLILFRVDEAYLN